MVFAQILFAGQPLHGPGSQAGRPHYSAQHAAVARRTPGGPAATPRRAGSALIYAPLLHIATLCIVAGADICAAPPHRNALHRRRRGYMRRSSTSQRSASSPARIYAPLLHIATLCIVAGADHRPTVARNIFVG